jgi:putative flippase GtrA
VKVDPGNADVSARRGGRVGAHAGDAPARLSTTASFVRYLLAGLATLGADLAVYRLLIDGLAFAPLAANGVSRPVGGVVCFFLNKHWTFENRGRGSSVGQFVRFWCVFAMSFLLSEALLWGFYDLLHLESTLAKLAAEAIVVVFNYVCLRLWTFRA